MNNLILIAKFLRLLRSLVRSILLFQTYWGEIRHNLTLRRNLA